MKNNYTTAISKKPFELLGFTLDEYYLWCKVHSLSPYKISTKREFFKKVDEYVIVKRNNKLFENNEELK